MSFYKVDHLLPSEVALTSADLGYISPNSDLSHKGMRETIGQIRELLEVKEFECPNLQNLIARYCQELELPSKSKNVSIQ